MNQEVAFEDMDLLCKDCNKTFAFPAEEQRFFAKHGFMPPVRCDVCRAAKKGAKKAGNAAKAHGVAPVAPAAPAAVPGGVKPAPPSASPPPPPQQARSVPAAHQRSYSPPGVRSPPPAPQSSAAPSPSAAPSASTPPSSSSRARPASAAPAASPPPRPSASAAAPAAASSPAAARSPANDVASAGVAKYSSAERFHTPALRRGTYREALTLFHQAMAMFGNLSLPSANRADGVGVLRNIAMANLKIHQTFRLEMGDHDDDDDAYIDDYANLPGWSDAAIRDLVHFLLQAFEAGCDAVRIARTSRVRDQAWCDKLGDILTQAVTSMLRAVPLKSSAVLLKCCNSLVAALSGRQRLGSTGCDNSEFTAVLRGECLLNMAETMFDSGVMLWSEAVAEVMEESDDDDDDDDDDFATSSDSDSDASDSDSEAGAPKKKKANANKAKDHMAAMRERMQRRSRLSQAGIDACSKCLATFAHADRLAHEAESVLEFKCDDDDELVREARPWRDAVVDMLARIDVQKCVCASVRERINADAMLAQVLLDCEAGVAPDHDAVWPVVDSYKYAASLCQERDIEGEAIALSRIGSVYFNVFKLDASAYRYFDKAMELAKSLQPRNLVGEPWFDEICRALRKRQLQAERDSMSELERQQDLIKTDLAALKSAESSKHDAAEFVRWVYATHPPRVPNPTPLPETITRANLKKVMLQAVAAYHPDKNTAQEGDNEDKFKWQYLCNEITKLLNSRYEREFKGSKLNDKE